MMLGYNAGMKTKRLITPPIAVWMLAAFVLSGCATIAPPPPRAVVLETWNVSRPYEVIGPVSATEQISEDTGDTLQGIAGFLTQDGNLSGQVPPGMKAAWDAKNEKYKEMMFDMLGLKAKTYGADAVLGARYAYVPPYATFSTKASVSAKGTMVRYTN